MTRVDLSSREVTESGSLGVIGTWKLSRGDDGTIVAFDGRDNPSYLPREDARLIDPVTLEATTLDAPEPLSQVIVFDRNLIVAAGDQKLYRYDAGVWTVEASTAMPIDLVLRGAERLIAVVEGTTVRFPASGQPRSLCDGGPGQFIRPRRVLLGDGYRTALFYAHFGRYPRVRGVRPPSRIPSQPSVTVR